jgi:hypothetical protein
MPTADDIEVFISHSNSDEDLVRATVDFLNAALRLDPKQVRCTSLDGYRLPAGVNTDDRVRDEVLAATVFIGILSPASLASTYVLFELGARWAVQRRIFPMLARGVESRQLRPPLSNLNVLSMHELPHLHQFVREIGEELGIQPHSPDLYHRHMTEVIRLAAPIPPQEERIAPFTNETNFVLHLQIEPPRVVIADGMPEVERTELFRGVIRALEVSEATTVRVRYDWQVHIMNSVDVQRGFYGHVSFRDANGYEVARHDISILRPYRAPRMGEQTYHSFVYVAPEHARFIRTVELSLLPIQVKGWEDSPAVTLEWRGVWPT